jgi:hypothetical protein
MNRQNLLFTEMLLVRCLYLLAAVLLFCFAGLNEWIKKRKKTRDRRMMDQNRFHRQLGLTQASAAIKFFIVSNFSTNLSY